MVWNALSDVEVVAAAVSDPLLVCVAAVPGHQDLCIHRRQAACCIEACAEAVYELGRPGDHQDRELHRSP